MAIARGGNALVPVHVGFSLGFGKSQSQRYLGLEPLMPLKGNKDNLAFRCQELPRNRVARAELHRVALARRKAGPTSGAACMLPSYLASESGSAALNVP